MPNLTLDILTTSSFTRVSLQRDQIVAVTPALSDLFLPGESFLQLDHLFQPALMPLSLGKTRRQESTNQVIRQRWADDPGTQAENIGIIILATLRAENTS